MSGEVKNSLQDFCEIECLGSEDMSMGKRKQAFSLSLPGYSEVKWLAYHMLI